MSDPDRERRLRRRSIHERQAVVFGVILAALAVGGLVSAAVFSGALHLSFFDRTFSTPAPPTAKKVPCPPSGALPVATNRITVNVLNASSRVGLAAQTAKALADRGFVIGRTANSGTPVSGTASIIFGPAGIAQAYTLAANVTGATLSFDAAHADAGVDLALGSSFEALTEVAKVGLDPQTPLVNIPGCVPVSELLTPTPTPAG